MRKKEIAVKIKFIILILPVILCAAGTAVVYAPAEHNDIDGIYEGSDGSRLVLETVGQFVAVFKDDSDTENELGDMHFLKGKAESGAYFVNSENNVNEGYGVMGNGVLAYCTVNRYGSYDELIIYKTYDSFSELRMAGKIIFPIIAAVCGTVLMFMCIRRQSRIRIVITTVICALSAAVILLSSLMPRGNDGIYQSGQVEDNYGDRRKIDMYFIDSGDYVSAVIGYDDWSSLTIATYPRNEDGTIEALEDDRPAIVLFKKSVHSVSVLNMDDGNISMITYMSDGTQREIDFYRVREPVLYLNWIAAFPVVMLPVICFRKKNMRSDSIRQNDVIPRRTVKAEAKGRFKDERGKLKNSETDSYRHRLRKDYLITGLEFLCGNLEYMREYLMNNQIGNRISEDTSIILNGIRTDGCGSEGIFTEGGIEYIIEEEYGRTRFVIRCGGQPLIVYAIERMFV